MSGNGIWDGLTPPYATIVADPPWKYSGTWATFGDRSKGHIDPLSRRPLPYATMGVSEIAALPVGALAAQNAHLYLWTTNRHLRAAYTVAESWGFVPSQMLVWCKTPKGLGLGGAFVSTTEFILFARRGNLAPQHRADSTWWQWPRGPHSVKPPAFMDIVERVSPGPYVELFARQPRLGWDHWGHGYELTSPDAAAEVVG